MSFDNQARWLPARLRASVDHRRAEAPLVVAIDIGTSSVRGGLYDRAGRLVSGSQAQRAYQLITAPDGGASVDPELLSAVVADVVDATVARAERLLTQARAVAVTGFLHSLVGLDRDGRPSTAVLTWADTTSAAEAETLRMRLDATDVWQRTGCPLHASYWPAKILRLRAIHRGVATWSGFPEFLIRRLTGQSRIGLSMASATGLFNRADEGWDGALLDELQIDERALPQIAEDEEPVRALAGDAALRWPQLAGVPWFGPWSDAACGNVGVGCTTPDRAALMIGTSSAFRVLVPDRAVPVPPGLFGFRLGRTRTLLGGQLSEGGGSVAWLARVFGQPAQRLERAAAALPADGHGLTLLPFLAGERGVGYHSRLRGAVSGLSLETSSADLFRAMLEAIAYRIGLLQRLLGDALGRRPAIVASGGALTRSSLWTQIIADVLGQEIERSGVPEASSRGAALLALHGIEAIGNLRLSVPGSAFRPDPGRHQRYAAAMARQEALYRDLLDQAEAGVVSRAEDRRRT